MEDATLLYLTGCLSFIAGTLMIVFRRAGGIAFCRFGRSSLGDRNLWGLWFQRQIDEAYDEAAAPRRFFWIGIVFIAQSPVFFVSGYLL